jgi:hypothetical protein
MPSAAAPSPSALAAFAKLPAALSSTTLRAWRTRAALSLLVEISRLPLVAGA